MSLDELSVGERACSNCGSYSCQGLLVAFAGKQAKDCASWNESSVSVRVRAEKRIAELEFALRKIYDRAHEWNAIPLCVELEQMAFDALGLKGGA